MEKLRVSEGDILYAIETPPDFEIMTYDPDVARQMETAERLMDEYRDIFRKLE